MTKKPEPCGLRVNPADTGNGNKTVSLKAGDPFTSMLEQKGLNGQPASIALGEDFNGEITWHDGAFETKIAIANWTKTGKPVLLMQNGRVTCVYRGFEEATNTWWRWEHEADPAQYREHCVRILSLG